METGWQSEIVTLPDTGANASEAYGRRTAARTADVQRMTFMVDNTMWWRV
jgi:hypothetical protein